MTVFVKPLMLSVFAAGSLALAGGQQEPARPPAPPAPPRVPGVSGDVLMPAVAGQAGGRTVFVGPGGQGGGLPFGPGFTPFGDDPRTREMVKKLIDAKDDEVKDKLRGELKTSLAKAFDDRLKGQEKQVEELEKQLKRLKEMVGKRREAKTEIIADRLVAMEKEARGLGW